MTMVLTIYDFKIHVFCLQNMFSDLNLFKFMVVYITFLEFV